MSFPNNFEIPWEIIKSLILPHLLNCNRICNPHILFYAQVTLLVTAKNLACIKLWEIKIGQEKDY